MISSFLLLLLSATPSFGQEETPIKTNLSLTCTQLENGQIKLDAVLRARMEKSYVALRNATIDFTNVYGEDENELGAAKTNENGKAELVLQSDTELNLDEDQYFGILATYPGDKKHRSSEGDILFKGAYLDLETEEIDSVNTISVQLQTNNEEEDIDLEDIDIVVQVPRMFSKLTIATESTDEDGMVEIEIPNDLPGGPNGKLTLIASALDTDEFGNLETTVEKNWGIPAKTIEKSVKEEYELWSPNAPLWMVVTFAFLMSLVWFHFIVIIYKLYLINKESKTID